jgi:hypothetical protein
MHPDFETLVEQVKSRSPEEKAELKFLLERSLVGERRKEIRANFRRSQAESKGGKLKFSSSVATLKKSLSAS